MPEAKCGRFLRPQDLKNLVGFSTVMQTTEVCRTSTVQGIPEVILITGLEALAMPSFTGRAEW